MAGFLIGAQTTATMTPTVYLQGKGFSVGDSGEDSSGNEWVFVQAGAAITQYSVVAVDSTYAANPLSNANASAPVMVGVAAVAFASGEYGWVQQRGSCTIQVLASTAKNAGLHTTVTGGALDSTTISTSTNYLLIGITALSAGTAGGTTNVPALVSYPNVFRTTAAAVP
jgi:hypothetical protein